MTSVEDVSESQDTTVGEWRRGHRACMRGFLQRHYHRMHFYVSFELGVAKLLAWDEVWEC